ncbi:transcription/translation regulatory transformer protein RfaH [Solemya velum gill symbiont]|uniref:transcription/translation regulatory transformer protein RfaH n=1 Tax=Solemya velum gill symbiont TaxID=2340 RepID=UPI000996A900|nr:transcription/translation regulatory transformer protein RfaH [Solemya velum gill symbiont]OOY98795.1 hypothetical protein BOW19_07290 [Solemya velum gill symbiont]OOZ01082.1 hypothetical protein BOW20_06950 [Solemya velum gill symbiont]OOZ03250.1 hypothetical protein BOW21_07180 [Solemya velum gill symbiont]OOZ05508.1 hypothetical protein BOW22_07135 [Solemya velum gill symbiont]OOZ07746.1 hypothetical protein BOW23_07135 [Solemya velum gill symbiont]
MTWLAVQTKPRQEQIAVDNLERQGFVVYYPRISKRKRLRGSWQMVTSALFPGYLFLQADLQQQDVSVVRSTVGVAILVRFGTHLVPVPEEVIGFLQQHEDSQLQSRVDKEWPHKPGDRVEITEGPFAGLSGIYQVEKDDERIILLLDLLGRQSNITIERTSLGAVVEE